MLASREESWTIKSSLFGATLWAVLAIVAGSGRAPIGVIEVLFLFAALVIVPLALELGRVVAPGSRTPEGAVRRMQAVAAVLAVVAFYIAPGMRAAALSVPWAVVCALVALSGAWRLAGGSLSIVDVVAQVARLDLGIGGIWLLLSRAGSRPMGFQEPIVLLTAVHFHYTGFATTLIAAATLRAADRLRWHRKIPRATSILIAFLPFVLAAGFVISPTLKVSAAVVLSLTIATLAVFTLGLSFQLIAATARMLLRVASCAVLAGMSLATVYAVGDYSGRAWLVIPRMASNHGVLNGVGFVLAALLGWLVEIHTVKDENHQTANSEQAVTRRSVPSALQMLAHDAVSGRAPRRLQFVARDYYDR